MLFVCPEAPYPALGGGAQRTASLIEYCASRGAEIDVLTFLPFQPPPGLIRETMCIPLPPNGRSLAARILRNTGRVCRGVPPLIDRLSGFEDAIRRQLGGRTYDLAVLEHFWLAPYVDLVREHASVVWCDLHNVESEFFASLAGAAPLFERWVHRRFARLSSELEKKLLPRFDLCLVCSEEDAARLSLDKTIVFPNTIPWRERPRSTKSNSIVFSGNMEYHPNQQGIRWFFHNVWPRLRSEFPAIRWRLVGMNPEAIRRFVSGDPAVEIAGAVPDAIAEIATAQVSVVPLLSGSGTRVKILEAWAAGTAVVSTSIGAEGLPTDGALQMADSAENFADAVIAVLRDTRLRENLECAGHAAYQARFHNQAAWKILDEQRILNGSSPGSKR